MTHRSWPPFLATLVLTIVVPTARRLPAQTVTSGALTGVVRDTAGEPLRGVRVEVTDQATGFHREMTTLRPGEFSFRFLAPGRYDILAEMLGYRPTELRGVTVTAPLVSTVEIRLAPTTPPVTERTVVQAEVPGAAAGSALSWTLGRLELRDLPDIRRDAVALGRYAASGDADLSFEGLPASFNVVTIDALPAAPPAHPGLRSGGFDGVAFPIGALESATIEGGGADVDWGGFAGTRLTLHPLRGGRRFAARAWGDWTGSAVSRSDHYAPEDLGQNSFRGGLTVSGPVMRDTAAFALGVEVQRLETPVPPAWAPTQFDSALAAVATDTFGVNLAAQRSGRGMPLTAISGFGRFEWQANAENLLSVFATGTHYDADGPVLGAWRLDSPDAALDGNDLNITAALTSSISRKLGLELRAGLETGTREYRAGAGAATRLTAGPIAFWTDPSLPGRFQRTTFRAYESLHYTVNRHWLKLGGGGTFSSYDYAYGYRQTGEFVFGGVDQFAGEVGGFTQRVGRPQAEFKSYQFGGWLQDRWKAAPGLDLVFGFRLEWDRMPVDDIIENAAWVSATRAPGDTARQGESAIKTTRLEFSPRAGVIWDMTGSQAWILRLDGGLYHGVLDPAVMAEALALVGPVEGRRAVGAVDGWPAAPDSVIAPVTGPVLAPLAVGARSPRTGRVQAAISGSVGGGTTLHLGGVYRQTDFLVRRRDLNLALGASGRDQYGRQVYGDLVQTGGALLVEPGTNRRFSDFDEVLALNFDGSSKYLGLSARLDQRAARFLTFSAGYTYSRTTDNWVGARDARPDAMLSPFPDSLNGVDWDEDRSDFDIPHRFVLGAEVSFRAFRLAGFFRHQSGYPFTPGFREGVDANGDGSYRNDPATVDEAIPGVTELLNSWDCLRRQVGRPFVDRNSCRGPAERTFDVRLVIGPMRLGAPVELVIDAMNLIESNGFDVDRALYLVDPAQTTTIDPQTGDVTVPLAANPDFGRPVVRRGPGRFLRLGLRVNY
jgi:hypothetical protein